MCFFSLLLRLRLRLHHCHRHHPRLRHFFRSLLVRTLACPRAHIWENPDTETVQSEIHKRSSKKKEAKIKYDSSASKQIEMQEKKKKNFPKNESDRSWTKQKGKKTREKGEDMPWILYYEWAKCGLHELRLVTSWYGVICEYGGVAEQTKSIEYIVGN